MKLGLAEILETASKLKTKQEQLDYLRQNFNPGLGILLKMTFDKNLKWALPDGPPPYKPSEITDNEGMLYSEIRRLYIFHEGGNPHISDIRRQQLFQQLIESLDKNDANLLLGVKEKKLPYEGMTEALICEAYPGLLGYDIPFVPIEEPKKRRGGGIKGKALSPEHREKIRQATNNYYARQKEKKELNQNG